MPLPNILKASYIQYSGVNISQVSVLTDIFRIMGIVPVIILYFKIYT